MKNKDFDCVEMMHSGQVASEKRLENLSREERLDYWRHRHQKLLKEQADLRSKKLTHTH